MSELDSLLSLASGSEEIQARVNALFHHMLDEAERLILTGSTATKIKLISTAVPAMMSYMKQEDATQMIVLREVLTSLNEQIRGSLFSPQ